MGFKGSCYGYSHSGQFVPLRWLHWAWCLPSWTITFTQNLTVMFWSFGFETALKLWLRNFHDLVIFPVRHCERQQTLRPQWNWPWINVCRDLRLLQGFVLSPADNFAHSITVHCPSRWHFFLWRPFWTNLSLSNAHNQRDKYLLRNIRSQLPQWIQSEYSWGLDFRKSTLSKGCILPKPSRQLEKARPIVDYSSAWAKKLGGAVSTVLFEFPKSVFRFLLDFEHVHHIIHGITRLFSSESFAESGYVFKQTDTAGFYNRVEHGRMIAAVEFVMYTYASYAMKTEQGLDTVLQAHILKLERNLRVFHGHWRDKTKQYFHHNIGAFTGFSSILLDHSYFTVASQILRQCRGASMDPNLLCWVVFMLVSAWFTIMYSPENCRLLRFKICWAWCACACLTYSFLPMFEKKSTYLRRLMPSQKKCCSGVVRFRVCV